MGVKASQLGVTITFLDVTGMHITQELHSENVFFFSTPRPVDRSNNDPLFGSKDWLTDIVIVDNPSKLETLPHQTQIAATSAASPRVRLQWDLGAGQTGSQDLSLTICSGSVKTSEHLFVEPVKVLPLGTEMKADHKLFQEWSDASKFII